MNTAVTEKDTYICRAQRPIATAIMLIAAAILYINVSAQPYCRVRTYRTSDGLPSHNVSRIAQDSTDLIWVSTWGGLSNFDGKNFISYRSGERNGTLPTNRITAIWPDTHGRLWMHLYGELPYYLDIASGKFVAVSDDIAMKTGGEYHCRAISVAPEGIWMIGSRGKPTIRLNAKAPSDTALMEIWDTTHMASIGAHHITTVKSTPSGHEWIFTDTGISLYGSDVHADGVFMEPVELDGKDYFLTTDGRAYVYNSGKLTAISAVPGRPSVSAGRRLDDKRIMAATSSGIAIYDITTNRWSMITSPGGEEITDLYVDTKSRIWAFAEGGNILLASPESAMARYVDTEESMTPVTVSRRPLWLEDPTGTVWLAPRNRPFGYFSEFSGKVKPLPLVSPQLNYSAIPSIERYFIDNQSNLWLSGAHDLTCVTFGRRSINTIPLERNEEVRALTVNDDGTLLAGTATGIIGWLDPDGKLKGYLTQTSGSDGSTKAQISQSPQPFAYRIYSVLTDSKGTTWIGTKGNGLYTIDPKGKITNYHRTSDPYSIGCDSIYQVMEDSRGRIWLATYGAGVHMVRRDSTGGYRFIHRGNDMNGYPADGFNRVRRVEEGPGGVMFLSTTEGFLTVDGHSDDAPSMRFFRTTHSETNPSSLLTPNVMQILSSKKGRIYVATMEGVQVVAEKTLLKDNLKLKPIAMPATSSCINNVLALGETPDGRIYIVRESDIVAYNPSTAADRTLSHTDNAEFTEALPVYDGQNLWTGALNGPAFFTPDKKIPGVEIPKIIVTRVLHGTGTDAGTELNPSEITVAGNERHLTVEFAALDYADTGSLRYAYRLDGDTLWHNLGSEGKLKFNRLSPGNHTLYLRSTNSSGHWVNNTRQISLKVEPSFWESWRGTGVILLIILAVTGAAVIVYLQRRDNVRMSEINEQQRRTLEEITRVMHEQAVRAQAAREAEEARAGNTQEPPAPAPQASDYRLESPTIIDEDQEMMQRLLKFLDTRIGDENLKIEELAESVNMGRTVFYGKIKTLVGMSPSDFLRRLRLQRAQELIANSRMSFSQIAFAVGFSDPKYFTKCFKKETGMTPSEFRSKNQLSDNDA